MRNNLNYKSLIRRDCQTEERNEKTVLKAAIRIEMLNGRPGQAFARAPSASGSGVSLGATRAGSCVCIRALLT